MLEIEKIKQQVGGNIQDDLSNLRNKQFLEYYLEDIQPSYGLVTDFTKQLNNNKIPVLNTPFTKGNQKAEDWLLNSPVMQQAFNQLFSGLGSNKGNQNISQSATYNSNDRRFSVKTNLKDELINKLTEDLFFNRYKEINPRIDIGTSFGSENNWQANLGINLGKNKGARLNIGRTF
tara:strand:- start:241 stop:768 length:528 start_codon:yes stop_codon:yes gene_type:complete